MAQLRRSRKAITIRPDAMRKTELAVSRTVERSVLPIVAIVLLKLRWLPHWQPCWLWS